MPTVLRWKGYRFFFYAQDGMEPIHVHIEKDGHIAKIWLATGKVARNQGFTERQLVEILRKVADEKENIAKKWDEFFG